jgi:hypothetical protein
VNGDVVLVDPNGVPNMVETMALIDDTTGFTFVETSESRVRVGLVLSVVKDTEEVTVELGPSMDSGKVVIPKVGLFGSKYGKGGGDDSYLLEEGSVEGVCKIAKGKLVARYSVRCSSNESLLSSAERDFVLRCFLGNSMSLALGSMVKADGLKRYKGVRLYDDSPKLTSGPLPRSLRDLLRDHGSTIVNIGESNSLSLEEDYD